MARTSSGRQSEHLKQKVLSYWLCLSITWKIKEEASQKNQEDEAGRGGHRAVGVK